MWLFFYFSVCCTRRLKDVFIWKCDLLKMQIWECQLCAWWEHSNCSPKQYGLCQAIVRASVQSTKLFVFVYRMYFIGRLMPIFMPLILWQWCTYSDLLSSFNLVTVMYVQWSVIFLLFSLWYKERGQVVHCESRSTSSQVVDKCRLNIFWKCVLLFVLGKVQSIA